MRMNVVHDGDCIPIVVCRRIQVIIYFRELNGFSLNMVSDCAAVLFCSPWHLMLEIFHCKVFTLHCDKIATIFQRNFI